MAHFPLLLGSSCQDTRADLLLRLFIASDWSRAPNVKMFSIKTSTFPIYFFPIEFFSVHAAFDQNLFAFRSPINRRNIGSCSLRWNNDCPKMPKKNVISEIAPISNFHCFSTIGLTSSFKVLCHKHIKCRK